MSTIWSTIWVNSETRGHWAVWVCRPDTGLRGVVASRGESLPLEKHEVYVWLAPPCRGDEWEGDMLLIRDVASCVGHVLEAAEAALGRELTAHETALVFDFYFHPEGLTP